MEDIEILESVNLNQLLCMNLSEFGKRLSRDVWLQIHSHNIDIFEFYKYIIKYLMMFTEGYKSRRIMAILIMYIQDLEEEEEK